MIEPITIVVLWDAYRLAKNPARRMNPGHLRRLKNEALEAATLGWRMAGEPVLNCPVVVDIIVRRGRRYDPDSTVTSVADLIDGLFKHRITPDDSSTWITYGEVRQEINKAWRYRPEVVFRVAPQHAAMASGGGCPAAAPTDRDQGGTPILLRYEVGWARPAGARCMHYWRRQSRAAWSACGKWQYGHRLRHREDLEPQTKLCKACAACAMWGTTRTLPETP